MKAQLVPIVHTLVSMPKTFTDPIDVLARTLWGEARGESVRGIEAVACVILNRVAKAQNQGITWWGQDIMMVCRKPFQFSCWNRDDLSFEKLHAVTEDDPVFAMCLRIARRAMAGGIIDATQGATHYHACQVHPAWAQGKSPCAEIGNHFFYNDIS